MHRVVRWAAIVAGAAAAALELRSWRQALLGVGDLPEFASKMVDRHASLDARQPSDDLGWPMGVEEDDDARWHWERGDI